MHRYWQPDYSSVVVVTAPTVEPVSLDEAKSHCWVTLSDDDELIKDELIPAARTFIERRAERALITQTLRWKFDRWPTASCLYVPRPPLQSVSSIQYVDGDGDTQTWGSANYIVDTDSEPGRIALEFGIAWPTLRTIIHAVTVNYVAGYGSTASTVPSTYRQVIKMIVKHWYDNRDDFHMGALSSRLGGTIDALLESESFGAIR